MKLWKTKNADGATAAICCMTREYAEAVMSGADDLDHEGNCAVADKNLEFAYLVELLHQKKQGVTVDYLLSVAEEFDIKLSETSLHIYCQPFTVGESNFLSVTWLEKLTSNRPKNYMSTQDTETSRVKHT